MAVATVEEPMLYRLDRLDNIVRQLEEIRGGNRTPKSSNASSCTLTSDGQASSLEFSPRSLEKHCRPIDAVMVETGVKGTLIERLVHVEERVAKLEEELKRRRIEEEDEKEKNKKVKKSGLKQLVKSCVTGNSNKSKQS